MSAVDAGCADANSQTNQQQNWADTSAHTVPYYMAPEQVTRPEPCWASIFSPVNHSQPAVHKSPSAVQQLPTVTGVNE